MTYNVFGGTLSLPQSVCMLQTWCRRMHGCERHCQYMFEVHTVPIFSQTVQLPCSLY